MCIKNFFISGYKTWSENTRLLVLSVIFTLFLSLYLIGWHITSLIFCGSFSVVDVAREFIRLSSAYLILSLAVSIIICVLLIVAASKIAKKAIIIAVMILFSATEIIRMFDWGALFFGGNHIDSNFWAHAFYSDGLVFLISKHAFALYFAAIIFFILALIILKKLSQSAEKFIRDNFGKFIARLIVLNLIFAIIAGSSINGLVYLSKKARDRSNYLQLGGLQTDTGTKDSEKILIDKSTILDEKNFSETVNKIAKKYKNKSNKRALLYTKIPESSFITSLFSYYFFSHSVRKKDINLDGKIINKYKEDGILLYTMDKNYPFMKKSIYINQRYRSYNKPIIKKGTNIIIIFAESFSRFFLRDDIHGLKGLTPCIKDFEKNSFSFNGMFNASYPTVNGLIASLGSGIYLLDERTNRTRVKIPCRFLFLSSILKALNYTTIHVQSASEKFFGMKDYFMKQENYDYFYGSESLIMKNIVSMNIGFGVEDSIMFDFVISWLQKRTEDKPFFLTISTINMHPPYRVSDKYPGAQDNILLNSIYSTDKAFGKFWEYIKKSKYYNNTIVIFTADHAMGNQHEFNMFANKYEQYVMPFYDKIPFIVHFPGGSFSGRTNETPCFSHDIPPTLMDMMNLDLDNPFMGLSIFSDRQFFKRKENSINKKALELNESIIKETKMVMDFYFNIYQQDRILPKDYKVKFH